MIFSITNQELSIQTLKFCQKMKDRRNMSKTLKLKSFGYHSKKKQLCACEFCSPGAAMNWMLHPKMKCAGISNVPLLIYIHTVQTGTNISYIYHLPEAFIPWRFEPCRVLSFLARHNRSTQMLCDRSQLNWEIYFIDVMCAHFGANVEQQGIGKATAVFNGQAKWTFSELVAFGWLQNLDGEPLLLMRFVYILFILPKIWMAFGWVIWKMGGLAMLIGWFVGNMVLY